MLFGDDLTFEVSSDEFIYHHVHRRGPILGSEHLLSFGFPKVSHLMRNFNHFLLQFVRKDG